MPKILIRYFKFLGTSIVGTIVDTLVLWFLSDLIFNRVYWTEYILSPIISFLCAVTVNFLISYFYVWKDRQVKTEQGKKRRFFKQYATYNLSSLGVFIFRLIILLAIERLTGWDVVICNLLAMGVSGVLNFIINNLIIFKKEKLEAQKKKAIIFKFEIILYICHYQMITNHDKAIFNLHCFMCVGITYRQRLE